MQYRCISTRSLDRLLRSSVGNNWELYKSSRKCYTLSDAMPRMKRKAAETEEASEAPKPKRGSRKPAVDAGLEEPLGETAEALKAPKQKRGTRKPAVAAGQEGKADATAEGMGAPKPKRGSRKSAKDAGEVTAAAGRPEGVVQHYLLKSEPHEFSIDDLEAAQGAVTHNAEVCVTVKVYGKTSQKGRQELHLPQSRHPMPDTGSTEPWDGVRNHQARNVMRGMRLGDLCFYYHSNCKEPGIVGIAEVVREAYPDSTALDAKSSKHDPKSTPEDPRWYMVDVKLVRKLARPVSLRELKERKGGELQGMALLTHGRLSVQPVSAQHWDLILGLEHEEAP